jgi:hypothetical protein
MRSHCILSILCVVMLALAPFTAARAQSMTTFEVGLPGLETPFETSLMFIQVGVRNAAVAPGRPGIDFAAATVPIAVAAGYLIVGMDADLTLPLAMGGDSRTLFAPRAGASLLFGGESGGGGGGGVVGWNVGFGFVQRVGPSGGFRVDLTYRRFPLGGDEAGGIGITSLTVGFAVH